MPTYTAITSKSIEYEYDIPIALPFDMGDETERLTDLQVRKACVNGSLEDMISLMGEATKTDDNGEEKLIAVYRDEKQIWPRPRKIKVATKASQIKFNDKHIFSEENMPDPLTED